MTRRTHLRLFLTFTAGWVAFWVGGLPSYYQQYSSTTMFVVDALLVLPLAALFLKVLRRVPRDRRRNRARWLAFYFSFPLAIYDALYCGVRLGFGPAFLWRFWYLSIYYVIPWVLLPALTAFLDHREAPRLDEMPHSSAGPGAQGSAPD